VKLGSDGIAKRLAEARTHAGLSRHALAKKAGLTHTTVARLEEGYLYPTTDTIERLAIAMGVRPCWLTFGDGPMVETKQA
jgi:transcriptional regulator with XRE-family HTH domain